MNKKIKTMIRKAKKGAKQKISTIRNETVSRSRKTAAAVRKYAHKDPWSIAGISALLAGIFAFWLGRKSKRS